MRVQTTQDRRPALADVRNHLTPVLGPKVAKRVTMHSDGTLSVEATGWSTLAAWLIDTVLVNGTAIGLGALYYARSSAPDKGVGAVVIAVFLLIVLPLVYGWFYGNGRAVGGLITGTRLVRMKDGGRIGFWKAGWAMMIRTLLIPFSILAVLDGHAGGDTMHGPVRFSIDVAATDYLRTTPFWRLP